MSNRSVPMEASADFCPWQSEVWQQLTGLAQRERLPHALLLEGPPGTGRVRFAQAFARWLLCAAPMEDGACGQCKDCTLTASGAHGDLFHLHPEDPGKAIGIDAVRAAIQFVSGTATRGVRKLLLVNPAEAMTTAAFNAFLKCLEEPSAGTHILMLAPRGYPLPATIRSRCQRWFLPAPESEMAMDWLRAELARKDMQADDNKLAGVIDLADNRPLLALELLGSDEVEALLRLRGHVLGEHRMSAFQFEQTAALVDEDRLLDTLEYLVQHWLRALAPGRLKASAGKKGFLALEELGQLRRARRAGSNPNPDLLKFSATQACIGLWD